MKKSKRLRDYERVLRMKPKKATKFDVAYATIYALLWKLSQFCDSWVRELIFNIKLVAEERKMSKMKGNKTSNVCSIDANVGGITHV